MIAMQVRNVPVNKLRPNPFRDLDLYPADPEHVAALAASIGRHGFFGGIKARKRGDLYEAGCGYHRIQAAKEGKLKEVPILVGDMTDDEMLNLMVTENGTQFGTNPAAVLNDVAAVARRLVNILIPEDNPDRFREISRTYPGLFVDRQAFSKTRGKLLARINDPESDPGVGRDLVLGYLGGKEESPRNEQQIRDAINTLKDSGRYSQVIDDALIANADRLPKSDTPAKGTEVQIKARPKRKPILDDRCAAVFPVDTQFRAFREAVTTEAARQFIPVNQQLKLAKSIVANMKGSFEKKRLGAPYVKAYVGGVVREALKQQKEINEDEKRRLYRDQRDKEIKAEVYTAMGSTRSLLSAMVKLEQLAKEFPGHAYFGDLGTKLGRLVKAIEQFRKALG